MLNLEQTQGFDPVKIQETKQNLPIMLVGVSLLSAIAIEKCFETEGYNNIEKCNFQATDKDFCIQIKKTPCLVIVEFDAKKNKKGFSLIQQLIQQHSQAYLVVISNTDNPTHSFKAYNIGAQAFFHKKKKNFISGLYNKVDRLLKAKAQEFLLHS